MTFDFITIFDVMQFVIQCEFELWCLQLGKIAIQLFLHAGEKQIKKVYSHVYI